MPNFLEGVLDAAAIGGWALDVATGALSWTPVMFHLHELDTSQPPSLESSFHFYPHEARPIVERSVSAAIEAGTPWDIEVPLITARGGRIWVRSWGKAIRDGARTMRLLGALQDVTARHEQAEWAQRLAAVGQQMSNPVIIMDREGRTEWVNKAFVDLTGYTTDDLRGTIAGEILQGPDTDPAVAEVIRRGVRDGDGFNVEILNHAKDGRPYWVAIKSTPIHDGSGAVTGFFEVETDVTAQREAEDTARREATKREQAEAMLRDVLDALPSAVIAYDRDERLVMWNRASVDMLPIVGRFAVPGLTLHELVRRAAENGQYPDAGTTEQEREQWIARQLAAYRTRGDVRTTRLPGGRYMQAREHLSESGNLVCVRTDITDQIRAESLLRDVLDALPTAVTAFDADERLILSNRAYTEMIPVSARFAIPGASLEEMIRLAAEHGQYADCPAIEAEREAWIATNVAIVRAAAGTPRTLRLTDGRIVQVRERRSESGNLVSVRTDTTELVRTEALLRDVLDALPTAVTAFDRDERLILSNRAYGEMLPIAARFATPGETLERMMRLATEHGQFADSGTTSAEREAWLADHLAFHRAPGEIRTLRLAGGRVVQALGRRSKTGNIVSVRTDTTELHRAEANLRIQAERDSLTLLANRSAFLAALDRALTTSVPEPPPVGALLLIDVDYFKQINDTLGHDIGDALLVTVAARLRALCRIGDVAARLGGDEFGILIPGLSDPRSLNARMETLHDALSAPVELTGRLLPISISLGVTMFPDDGTEATKLIKNADLALYEAKRNGRGRWSRFHPTQAEALASHVRLADALRDAISGKTLTIALQPQRLLRGGHEGFEALARWHDGVRWVPPLDFIRVAEETGLILPLGRAVMDAALARLRQLRDMGLRPGRVAVNVTGPQLLDANFMPETLAALERHGLRPADLEMELTETVLLGRAAEGVEAQLRAFSDLGITLALDDFGTGYASLASLSRFPIDRLKIDQSFVAGIGLSGPGGVIVRTVISLAHGLDMEVLAEGIETPEQLNFLEAAGCDAGQGYLFAKPLLTVEDAADYLRAQRTPPTHVTPRVAAAPGQ